MPDALIVAAQESEGVRVSKIAKVQGFRTKIATDVSSAIDWVNSRIFEVVITSQDLSENEIENLSTALWSRNNNAQFIIYSAQKNSPSNYPKIKSYLEILGVQFVSGSDCDSQIESILRNVIIQKVKKSARFQVMVVEDLSSPRDIICAFVEHLESAVVRGFASAHEALAELKQDPSAYSCIITDINMPEISGAELCRIIRADERLKHIPVIALTAYGTADILLNCLNAGASGFLVKPPSKSHMIRELSRAKRIILNNSDPRLVKESDVDLIREILEEKGYI